jgi:hypothetical protein
VEDEQMISDMAVLNFVDFLKYETVPNPERSLKEVVIEAMIYGANNPKDLQESPEREIPMMF